MKILVSVDGFELTSRASARPTIMSQRALRRAQAAALYHAAHRRQQCAMAHIAEIEANLPRTVTGPAPTVREFLDTIRTRPLGAPMATKQ